MLTAPHDLTPCLAPGDFAIHLGGRVWTDRTGRTAWAEFYLVLHHGGGVWTHLCRLVPGARLELVLVEAVPGDAREALRERFFGDQSLSSRAIEMK
ncbi:hypothetical protein [Sediminicoccus sp. BL-A-41-H5]|uniref:hypothetical protein n=1 Tax=Sediminicoccus sp. BL-A-41-H5 TaxID=3421106 RepID=UPI003D67A20A